MQRLADLIPHPPAHTHIHTQGKGKTWADRDTHTGSLSSRQ